MLQYRAYTAYQLENTGISFYHCVLIILYKSRSQGGGRTTTMLPSLRPDLLSRSPRLSPLPARLSPPLCCLAARPSQSLTCPAPRLRPPPFLRSSAQPSTSSYRSPTPLPRPVLRCTANAGPVASRPSPPVVILYIMEKKKSEKKKQ